MRTIILGVVLVLLFPSHILAAEMSDATAECLECHSSIAPGMVAAWENSRHARVSPAESWKKTELERRISTKSVDKKLAANVVGCAECHTLNPEKHSDTFEHNDYQVHIVVTPEDCATCHPQEVKQYGKNLMANAYGNLQDNSLYQDLVRTINGVQFLGEGQIRITPPSQQTNADACLSCHGTRVEVKGFDSRGPMRAWVV